MFVFFWVVLRFRKKKFCEGLATQTDTDKTKVQFYKNYVLRINIYFRSLI